LPVPASAYNTGGDNEGAHITGEGGGVRTAHFANTIIAGQDAALVIHTGNTAIVNGPHRGHQQ
jgi:hypothetical protein